MGFLNFLKPKRKIDNMMMPPVPMPEGQLPPETDLYSELPNLPEAPEASGLPDIDLPSTEPSPMPLQQAQTRQKNAMLEEPPEPEQEWKMPQMPQTAEKPEIEELPELPKMPSLEEQRQAGENTTGQKEEQEEHQDWLNPTAFQPYKSDYYPSSSSSTSYQKYREESNVVNKRNVYYIKAEVFRAVKDNVDELTKIQKKHHRLNELRTEENEKHEHLNATIEDIQRKLMQIDTELFEQER